jgi:hypothetical protein
MHMIPTVRHASSSFYISACCILLLGFTSMDTDLEQQLRLVEQELSQVQGLFFFFFLAFILELFFLQNE